MTQVPCNGCRACCQRNELIPLQPQDGDDVAAYAHRQEVKGHWFLTHQDNGDCAYLGPTGCTIYERRPAVCRAFDCRKFFLTLQALNRRERRRLASEYRMTADAHIMAAGKARLASLDEAEVRDVTGLALRIRGHHGA